LKNDYIAGLTYASVITGGVTGTQPIGAGWWRRDFTTTNRPAAGGGPGGAGGGAETYKDFYMTAGGYDSGVLIGQAVFFYFGLPRRIIDAAAINAPSIPVTFIAGLQTDSSLANQPAIGGAVVQGYGDSSDEGGLSAVNYKNPDGFIEQYYIWRSERAFTYDPNSNDTKGFSFKLY
jgi:hypothetical protein